MLVATGQGERYAGVWNNECGSFITSTFGEFLKSYTPEYYLFFLYEKPVCPIIIPFLSLLALWKQNHHPPKSTHRRPTSLEPRWALMQQGAQLRTFTEWCTMAVLPSPCLPMMISITQTLTCHIHIRWHTTRYRLYLLYRITWSILNIQGGILVTIVPFYRAAILQVSHLLIPFIIPLLPLPRMGTTIQAATMVALCFQRVVQSESKYPYIKAI
jgi:hypothetical protein